MLNSLFWKFNSWLNRKLVHKEEAKFIKKNYRKEIATAGINLQKIDCPVCKSNKWVFLEKLVNTDFKLICTTCGLSRFFNYRVLFDRLVALKKAQDAQANAPQVAAPQPAPPQEPPKEEEVQAEGDKA